VEVVDVWTGRRANALQRALRLTNEGLAELLGTAVRTVAKWSAEPSLVPVADMQQALDTLLSKSPDEAKARFAMLVSSEDPHLPAAKVAQVSREDPRDRQLRSDVERRIAVDEHIGAALEWLDRQAGWGHGTSRQRVAERLTAMNPAEVQSRAQLRGSISRQQVANALAMYYETRSSGHDFYTAECSGASVTTSILTRGSWLDLSLPLNQGLDHLAFTDAAPADRPIDDVGATAAVQRLADALASQSRIVNAPLYRLTSFHAEPGIIDGSVGLTNFVSYALTLDLLEGEFIDALAAGKPTTPGYLPLRDGHLPDVPTVLDIQHRLCAGGALALCAIARPGGRSRRGGPDYVLLVQERSGRVLNSARCLAVIPKAFHGPLADYRDDAQIGATLKREMEEELFGRDDVDSTLGDQLFADPMHSSRLSEPMRWLVEHDDGGHWRMECTGFGFNAVSGNFEFASMVVIEDEEWWQLFGGHVKANWESNGLRRYSSLDRDLLTNLVHNPTWSNEGLFALLQGIRRLSNSGGSRVRLPSVEVRI